MSTWQGLETATDPQRDIVKQEAPLEVSGEKEQVPRSVERAPANPEGEGPRSEAEQGGESSGNNASNGTTQKLGKPEEGAADASTEPKAPSDDLQELANRGLCAPLWRTAKPSQTGVGVPDVEQLQTGWCNYNGLQDVQRGAVWLSSISPSVQAELRRHSGGALLHNSSGRSGSQGGSQHQLQRWQRERGSLTAAEGSPSGGKAVLAARPPGVAALPPSPFAKNPAPTSPFTGAGPREGAVAAQLRHRLSEDSPFTPSSQSKFQWPEDAHSPRQSNSDGNQRTEAANPGLQRQVSLPDFGELADLWTEMSNAPEDYSLDLEALPSLPKSGSLVLPGHLSLGLRQNSFAKPGKWQEAPTPMGSLLSDIKSQRRNRSIKIATALTWQPGLDAPPQVQPRRNSGRLHGLQMAPAVRDSLSMADRTSSSGFASPEGIRSKGPELPEQVQLAIVAAPSIFAVPTCINKTFKPPFTVRVTIISGVKTQIKATVAAYTLQREQVAKLDQWHPSQHIFTESLSGSLITETISCDGAENPKTGEVFHGRHVGIGELTFTDLKFNASSRMKPRWVVFALALPNDDVIFTQFTVPTIVMSRQCDQTPRALKILRGETPTRKRARQQEAPEGPRNRPLYAGLASPAPLGPPVMISPAQQRLAAYLPPSAGRPGVHIPDQSSVNLGSMYEEESGWPQRGPFTMTRWREAIVKVCRLYELTRSFEQEDMHELAKIAGFMGTPATGNHQVNVLTLPQWNAFGRWFIGYLAIFRDHRELWMSPSIVCLCGFSVTRERAEHLLITQPEGTFLLRPSLSMDATIVISITSNARVIHLAIAAHQLESRTLEDWVRELPDTGCLLDINSGVRYPKMHVFRSRHPPLMPPTPSLLGLQSAELSAMVQPALNTGSLMPQPPAQVAGPEALAHILEASRRQASGGPFSPQLGPFGQGPNPLGHMAANGGSDHLGQLFDQWGQMDVQDPYRAQALGPHAEAQVDRRHMQPYHMHFGPQ